ncbi:DUF805 domain-containing protein [Macrococcoides goetzii]|uniref:DUF805 domain-containing protein n=1 Tax=Macrococcoides goetzii TaxID=1891097 RepID=A0A364JPL3_9STAP|nr:DUF805 domain-containing protein [Macrococcus goetzii]RAI82894.1 DUF805 domain-containing protein [Macrococcus goetzii]
MTLWSLINLIPNFTLTARRLQDLNYNGWLALIPTLGLVILIFGTIIFAFITFGIGLIFVPFIILLAILIQIGFFILTLIEGTQGPNQYGPDLKKEWHVINN